LAMTRPAMPSIDLLRSLLATVVLLSACTGSTAAESSTAVGEDEDVTRIVDLALARVDLETRASITERTGDSHLVLASLRALDRSNFRTPTLVLDYPADTLIEVEIIDPIECTKPLPTQTRCQLVPRWAQIVEPDGRLWPTDWLDLAFTATPATTEPTDIIVTAVSHLNELDNDPDLDNNVVTVTLNG